MKLVKKKYLIRKQSELNSTKQIYDENHAHHQIQ
jgi:hypothetical protein